MPGAPFAEARWTIARWGARRLYQRARSTTLPVRAASSFTASGRVIRPDRSTGAYDGPQTCHSAVARPVTGRRFARSTVWQVSALVWRLIGLNARPGFDGGGRMDVSRTATVSHPMRQASGGPRRRLEARRTAGVGYHPGPRRATGVERGLCLRRARVRYPTRHPQGRTDCGSRRRHRTWLASAGSAAR